MLLMAESNNSSRSLHRRGDSTICEGKHLCGRCPFDRIMPIVPSIIISALRDRVWFASDVRRQIRNSVGAVAHKHRITSRHCTVSTQSTFVSRRKSYNSIVCSLTSGSRNFPITATNRRTTHRQLKCNRESIK